MVVWRMWASTGFLYFKDGMKIRDFVARQWADKNEENQYDDDDDDDTKVAQTLFVWEDV